MADGPKPEGWQELIVTEIVEFGRDFVMPGEWITLTQELHHALVRGMVEHKLKPEGTPRLRFDQGTADGKPAIAISLTQWGSPEDA